MGRWCAQWHMRTIQVAQHNTKAMTCPKEHFAYAPLNTDLSDFLPQHRKVLMHALFPPKQPAADFIIKAAYC